MGFAHNPAFAKGTLAMAGAVSSAAGFTVAAGDGAAAVALAGSEVATRMDHVSGGGQAALALIARKTLPGVEALRSP
jgi:phosphoglycerate kinase